MILIRPKNDMLDSDIQKIVLNSPVGTNELQIIFNWQFAIATNDQMKLMNFLDSLDFDPLDFFLDDDCE